ERRAGGSWGAPRGKRGRFGVGGEVGLVGEGREGEAHRGPRYGESRHDAEGVKFRRGQASERVVGEVAFAGRPESHGQGEGRERGKDAGAVDCADRLIAVARGAMSARGGPPPPRQTGDRG